MQLNLYLITVLAAAATVLASLAGAWLGRKSMERVDPDGQLLSYLRRGKPQAFNELRLRGGMMRAFSLRSSSKLGRKSLRGVRLDRAVMPSADLDRSDLRFACFDGAQLNNSWLCHAMLYRATFRRADLAGANLSEADASEANFNRAALACAHLVRGVFCDADFSGAQMTGVSAGSADFSRASLVSLDASCSTGQRSVFDEANFFSAILTGAKLKGVDLSGARFNHADLSDADLCGADLTNARFQDADLSGVKFDEKTKLLGTNFAGAKNVPRLMYERAQQQTEAAVAFEPPVKVAAAS